MVIKKLPFTVLSIAVFTMTGCEPKPLDTYFDALGALHTSAPNEECLNSWFNKFDEYPETFLPEKSMAMPPTMDESLVEEALADQAACESLSSCWNSDAYGSAMFMQVCTRGRMKLRVEQYDDAFGG